MKEETIVDGACLTLAQNFHRSPGLVFADLSKEQSDATSRRIKVLIN